MMKMKMVMKIQSSSDLSILSLRFSLVPNLTTRSHKLTTRSHKLTVNAPQIHSFSTKNFPLFLTQAFTLYSQRKVAVARTRTRSSATGATRSIQIRKHSSSSRRSSQPSTCSGTQIQPPKHLYMYVVGLRDAIGYGQF